MVLEKNKRYDKNYIGCDFANFPDAYDISTIEFIQSKKHKKKRINKKWLKKYGVKQVTCIKKGWKVQNYCDNIFELVED